jgi:lipoprotein NlpI
VRHRCIAIGILLTNLWAAAGSLAQDVAPPRAVADLVDAEQALASGRTDAALKLAQRYVAGAPKDPRGHHLLGVIRDEQGRFEESAAAYTQAIRLDPKRAPAYQRRGVARFMAAKPKEAVEDFDKYLQFRPDERPHHWQRGIALYYAGRYEDGARQFELHKTVNPHDVENSAWHFLCVAKNKGVESARTVLIDVSGDERVPMMKVQELLAGKATPADVLAEAKRGDPGENELRVRMFYAHLYLGLYHEALGDAARAHEHIDLAAGKFHVEGYMGGVARVHANLARDKSSRKEKP